MGNTMTAADLHRITTNALQFAGKDETLPAICAVRYEFSADKVVAVSTDRFVLGATRADYTGEEFAVSLTRADADRLAKLAKTAKSRVYGDVRTVEIVPVCDRDALVDGIHARSDVADAIRKGLTNTVTSLQFVFSTGETLQLNTLDADFPSWAQLLPAEILESVTGHVGVDPAKIGQFTKVIPADKADHMVVTVQTPAKPVVVTYGASFIGLLMPIRLPEYEGFTRPEWIA